jgi:excinuclease ABC subunit C
MQAASVDEVAEVAGIGPKTAETIVTALAQRRTVSAGVNMSTGELIGGDTGERGDQERDG